jgi:hypothetical protein
MRDRAPGDTIRPLTRGPRGLLCPLVQSSELGLAGVHVAELLAAVG